VFLVSAAVLAAQVVLLRIFSIASFHHFAYMAVGMALLGFGASGTLLVVLEKRLRGRLADWFEGLATAFPVALVVGLWLAGRVPFEPTQLLWEPGQWLWLGLTYAVLTAPFLIAAGAIGIALMGAGERVGRIYAWSLIGSGLGSALALLLLVLARPDRAYAGVVVVAAVGAVAALASRGLSTRRAGVAAAVVVAAVGCVLAPPWPLAVTQFKGLPQVEAFPDARRVDEAWAPTGWVAAVESSAFRHAPGLSLAYRGGFPRQIALFVDGETAGAATRGDGSLEFLEWLPSSAAYAMRSTDRVLVLGSGGGLEVLNALHHGASRVTGVELVGPLVEVARRVAGAESDVARRPNVRTVIGDARAFVAGTDERFDLIVLPLAGSMPTAAAGVYSLGEDWLNTVEAYGTYLDRLTPGGTLAVTRWTRTPPRDNVRLILTVAEALRGHGAHDVGASVIFLRSWATGTLLVKPAGFDSDDLSGLRSFARERRFDLDWPPEEGTRFNRIEAPVFTDAVRAAAGGANAAAAFAEAYPFRVNPATDDRPYFGRFLRMRAMARLLREERGAWLPFAEWGTLAVVATLFQSGMLALVLIGIPAAVLVVRGKGRGAAPMGAYFAALGLGYVFLAMGAIQRLGLLLGHPVYAAAATLAALLTFSGVGSALSDRLDRQWAPRACLAVAGLAAVVALASPAAGAVTTLPVSLRILVALVLVAVPGTLMGVPFPLGLRHLTGGGVGVAWAWATNGVASVVGASLAILIAMEMGGRGLLAAAALLYLGAAAVWRWGPAREVP